MSKPRTWRIEFDLRGNESAGARRYGVSKPKKDLRPRDIGVILLCLCLAAGNNGATINAGAFLFLVAIAGCMAGARDLKGNRDE